jgi:threonyl-tRNA synthetase
MQVDASAERVQKKIRNAEVQKIPLTAVVGPAEAEGNSLAMRARFVGDIGSMPVGDVADKILQAVANNAPFDQV